MPAVHNKYLDSRRRRNKRNIPVRKAYFCAIFAREISGIRTDFRVFSFWNEHTIGWIFFIGPNLLPEVCGIFTPNFQTVNELNIHYVCALLYEGYMLSRNIINS